MIFWGLIIVGYFLCVVIVNFMAASDKDIVEPWDNYKEQTHLHSNVGFILVEKKLGGKKVFSFFPFFVIRNLKDGSSATVFFTSLLAPLVLIVGIIVVSIKAFLKFITSKTVANFFKVKLYTEKDSE